MKTRNSSDLASRRNHSRTITLREVRCFRGNGSGATNFGDSGGPVLLPGTNVVVGITSFGLNAQGTGPGFAFRTDTAESQTFLNAVFTLYDPANNPFSN